jgi:hypothetical protein
MLAGAVSICSVMVVILAPCAVITAVTTWITPVPGESKWIVREGAKAIVWRWQFGRWKPARCPQVTGHGSKFGRKKEDAIVALLTHRTIEEAARAIKASTKTLLRWQKEPEFDAAYRLAKRAAFGQAIARLHHLSGAAVSTLGKVMLDPATPPATKVRAADSILQRTSKAIEDKDIEARVAALEQAAPQGNQKR